MIRDNLYFRYNGYSSKDKGIILCSIDGDDEEHFSLKRSLDKKDGIGDIPIINKIKNETLSIPMTFTKVNGVGDSVPITRYELDELNRVWFTQKQESVFITEDGFVLYGIFTGEMKQWFNSSNQGYIKCDFELTRPFMYTPNLISNVLVENESVITLNNNSNCNELSYPEIEFELMGDTTDIKFQNLATGEICEFKGLNKNEKVAILNEEQKQVISLSNPLNNIFSKFNKEFIGLEYGRNNIKITCNGKAKVTFSFQIKLAF